LLLPSRSPEAIGATADVRTADVQLGAVVYPEDGSIARLSVARLQEGRCTDGRPAGGEAQVRELALLDGAVTATAVRATVGGNVTLSVEGLEVEGRPVATGGGAVALQGWGAVSADSTLPIVVRGGRVVAALSVRLLRAHDDLPIGTVILVAAVAFAPPPTAGAKAEGKHRLRAHRNTHRPAGHEPLSVTPPLGERHFIFPVVGSSEYIDTYGAFRSDVPGNWHHGDDIFAPLGTPVVAVVAGTINRVGWEQLGGWRLWVRDNAGDEFYYAHLSGYAPTDLHTNLVHAGEVIGFIGNTGDAFTTAPHLHFEVHPRSLLHLGYDGAVDPTRYLNTWTRLAHVRVPVPTHPPLPSQPLLRQEARYVFRELLAARHLIRRAPKATQRPHVPVPAGANGPPIPTRPAAREATPAITARPRMSTLTFALLVALAAVALFAAVVTSGEGWSRLRRRRSAAADPANHR
jgi:murein DD-endopeptidase MepM/ murein hydrolase activator NlpD